MMNISVTNDEKRPEFKVILHQIQERSLDVIIEIMIDTGDCPHKDRQTPVTAPCLSLKTSNSTPWESGSMMHSVSSRTI